MKKTIEILLLLSMLLFFAGCSKQESSSFQTSASQSNSENQPAAFSQKSSLQSSGASSSSEVSSTSAVKSQFDNRVIDYYMSKANKVIVTNTHVTFTDDSGRGEISIEKNPKKVAVLYGSLTCLWYEAGGTAQSVIGGKSAAALYEEQIGRDITQDEGVKVVSNSLSGSNWDIETILAEQPDLIVCAIGMKGYATTSGPAETANIPVIGINYDTVQDYLKWFKVFCNLTGRPELWDSIAGKTASRVADVVSKVPESAESPRAVILVINSNILKAYTGKSQPGGILNELGGLNLADPDKNQTGSSIEISMEDLYALDPDLILFSEYGEAALATLDELYGNDPVWQSLNAVKEKKIYALERTLYHNKANQNYDKAYRAMAEMLYPDIQF